MTMELAVTVQMELYEVCLSSAQNVAELFRPRAQSAHVYGCLTFYIGIVTRDRLRVRRALWLWICVLRRWF